MNKKHILITGATNGIGKEFAKRLVKDDVHLILVARNEGLVKDTISELQCINPNATFEYLLCDFTNLAGTQSAIDSFCTQRTRLDLIIHNAGAIPKCKAHYTNNQIPFAFCVNYLAPKLINEACLKLLNNSSSPQIIHTTSLSVPNQFDYKCLSDYDKFGRIKAYATSKMSFYLYLAQEVSNKIPVKLFDPGIVYTNAATGMMPKIFKWAHPLVRIVAKDPAKVAAKFEVITKDESDCNLILYKMAKPIKLRKLTYDSMLYQEINQYLNKFINKRS